MTESRVGAGPRSQAPGGGAATGWYAVADLCAASGPFPASLVVAWRRELGAVQRRVRELEQLAHYRPQHIVGIEPGVHALVALASARRGAVWRPDQLVDVAGAVELAYRATCHHAVVADRTAGNCTREENKRHVLDGDWSITQAAVLVADISPLAYRLLVRGYGGAQLGRLEGVPTMALLTAAASLGALVAGAADPSAARDAAGAPHVAARVLAWAGGQPVPFAEPAGGRRLQARRPSRGLGR